MIQSLDDVYTKYTITMMQSQSTVAWGPTIDLYVPLYLASLSRGSVVCAIAQNTGQTICNALALQAVLFSHSSVAPNLNMQFIQKATSLSFLDHRIWCK